MDWDLEGGQTRRWEKGAMQTARRKDGEINLEEGRNDAEGKEEGWRTRSEVGKERCREHGGSNEDRKERCRVANDRGDAGSD